MLPLILSSDSHVFEPPDLWQTRIDRAFRDRAPRLQRIDGADQIVVEADQILSGIGLISNAGARFEAPETISAQGRFEDVHRGGYDPEQHLKDMALDGVAGEVLYPSQGLFYFKVADTLLMSAIFRAYNDWLADFCRTDPARLKGIAMINLDDVQDGIKEEDAIGIRLRDVIGVDNMMWGSDYPHSELTFPRSRKILAEILAGVPDDEQAAKIDAGNTARVYNFDVARLTVPA